MMPSENSGANSIRSVATWGPVFVILKKEATVGFITNFCRLKQQLVRKSYPLPIISDNTQKL